MLDLNEAFSRAKTWDEALEILARRPNIAEPHIDRVFGRLMKEDPAGFERTRDELRAFEATFASLAGAANSQFTDDLVAPTVHSFEDELRRLPAHTIRIDNYAPERIEQLVDDLKAYTIPELCKLTIRIGKHSFVGELHESSRISEVVNLVRNSDASPIIAVHEIPAEKQAEISALFLGQGKRNPDSFDPVIVDYYARARDKYLNKNVIVKCADLPTEVILKTVKELMPASPKLADIIEKIDAYLKPFYGSNWKNHSHLPNIFYGLLTTGARLDDLLQPLGIEDRASLLTSLGALSAGQERDLHMANSIKSVSGDWRNQTMVVHTGILHTLPLIKLLYVGE